MKIFGKEISGKTLPKATQKLTATEKFVDTKKTVFERQNTLNTMIPLMDQILAKYESEIASVFVDQVKGNCHINIKYRKPVPPVFCMIETAGFKGLLRNYSGGFNTYSSEDPEFSEYIEVSKN